MASSQDPNETRAVRQADGRILYITGFPYWLHSRHWPIESRLAAPFTLDKLVTGWKNGIEIRKRLRHAQQG